MGKIVSTLNSDVWPITSRPAAVESAYTEKLDWERAECTFNASVEPGMIPARAERDEIVLVLDVFELLRDHRLDFVDVVVSALVLSC